MTASATSKLDFILRLVDQVTTPAAKASKALMDVAEVGKTGFMQVGTGVAGVAGSVMAFREALAPALEQTNALGEIRSLGVAQEALDALNQASMEFAANYGQHATDFVRSAYKVEGAIKGLTGSELATITTASNVLAKATKADADTMTTYIGTMYGLFQGQADAMGRAQWVDQLSGQTARAVQLYRTSGEQMSEAFKATGIGASAAGTSLVEQMAVLGTLSQTLDGGEAGGLFKSFFENVSAAQGKLGMQFTDSAGRLLPILQILDKLQAKFGNLTQQSDLDALTEAFGGEAARMIVTLLKDTDSLARGLDELGKVKGLQRAEDMARAMVDPWQQLGSVLENIRISFGQVLLPVLNPFIMHLVEGGKTFQRWLKLFPNIARWLGYITLGILALVAAAGALTVLGGLVTLFSLLVSPIALVLLGIAALVLAIGAAVLWWDELKASFGNTAWFQALVIMATPVVLLFRIFAAVLELAWIGLQQIWTAGVQVVAWLGELLGVTTQASGAWQTLLTLFTQVSPFALIGKALKGLIALLNRIPGISIDAEFGEVPELPPAVTDALQFGQQPLPYRPQALAPAPTPDQAPVPLEQTLPSPMLAATQPPGIRQGLTAYDRAQRPLDVREALARSAPSLSPARPTNVPPGGLLKVMQTTNNTTTRSGPHIENLTVNTSEPLTPYALENLITMAAG